MVYPFKLLRMAMVPDESVYAGEPPDTNGEPLGAVDSRLDEDRRAAIATVCGNIASGIVRRRRSDHHRTDIGNRAALPPSDDRVSSPQTPARARGAVRNGTQAMVSPRRVVERFRTNPREARHAIAVKMAIWCLNFKNRFSRRSVTGSAAVVVSLTTYGFRAEYVHLAIESICAGSVRPQRIILWIDDELILDQLPAALRRLQNRGLEIAQCADYGPHKKQYPYAVSKTHHSIPMATADDDVLYPRRWLEGLISARARSPNAVIGYRAHQLVFKDGVLEPYATWPPRRSNQPSFQAFCTGVSGVLYPPALLDELRDEGARFMELCPRADDVWVHFVSVRHGFKHQQVFDTQAEFQAIPAAQAGTLYGLNVIRGGNDKQLADTYSSEDLDSLAAALA